MASGRENKITTIKLKKDTKLRLDHFKEYRRESYEEVMEKMLHILNIVRGNPEAAQGILRKIDLKLKRKPQVYEGIPQERRENAVKLPAKPNPESQEKGIQNSIIRNKFMINRKTIRK